MDTAKLKDNTMIERSVLMVANFTRRGNGPAAYVPDLINSIKEKAPNIRIDVLIGAQGAYLNKGEVSADTIYVVSPNLVERILLKIPKLRVFIWYYLKERLFKRIVSDHIYDSVVFHSLQPDSDALVSMAKQRGSKVVLFPWGSEVLRASENVIKRLKMAFEKADYIRGDSEQFVNSLMTIYPTTNKSKFVNITYASPGLTYIDRNRGKSRTELADVLSLPDNRFYIVCGYNAYEGQQHKAIIESISKVKSSLPVNYLLVFPITYGSEQGVDYHDIERWCSDLSLPFMCLTNYMTDEQVACLHLITDVFIHVQKTDLYNSFLQESVYAGNCIINGEWLKYPELEDNGKPYYTCKSIDNLPDTIQQALGNNDNWRQENTQVTNLSKYTWPSVTRQWIALLSDINAKG